MTQGILDQSTTTGVVIAGGLSTRMEGVEKSLLMLNDKTLMEHVVDSLVPQVSNLVINANGDPQRFSACDFPVQPDTVEGFAGPLAGILAGMIWSRQNHPPATHIVTAAADTPFYPATLVQQLTTALRNSRTCSIAIAKSGGYSQPTFGLWPVSLIDELHTFLVKEGKRKIMLFAKRHGVVFADFPVENGLDPFFNINTPNDHEFARKWLANQ